MISVLLIKTANHRFALRREDVESVVLLPSLQSHAGDISLIEGWLNLRGDSVPTISLAGILGLGEEPPELSDHLILTVQRPRIAWRVRRVLGLAQTSWEELRMLEHSAEPTPCYVAEFVHEAKRVTLINVSGLLLAEEQARLKRSEERRLQRLSGLTDV